MGTEMVIPRKKRYRDRRESEDKQEETKKRETERDAQRKRCRGK